MNGSDGGVLAVEQSQSSALRSSWRLHSYLLMGMSSSALNTCRCARNGLSATTDSCGPYIGMMSC